MPSNTGLSDLRPSFLLTDPVSVPGMGSLILIDAVIHSAAALNHEADPEEEQVCEYVLPSNIKFRGLALIFKDFFL